MFDIQPYLKEGEFKNEQLSIEIISDIKKISKNDPLIKNLILQRNNHIVHDSYGTLIKELSFMDISPLTYADYHCLIIQGQEILNKYSAHFFHTSFTFNTATKDDFKEILESIKYYGEENKFIKKTIWGTPIHDTTNKNSS